MRASRSLSQPAPTDRAICAAHRAKVARRRRILARPFRSSSSLRHASPRTPEGLDCVRQCSLRNAAGCVSSHAFRALHGASADAVPPDTPHVCAQIPCQPAMSASDRTCPCQTMLTTIFRSCQTAATPRFNVNHPEGLTRRVLKMSQIHRSSSMLRRNLTCCAIALLNVCAEIGRLPYGLERQD